MTPAWPRHVAIIMDGNGRWATERGLPRVAGHRKGADVVRDITTCAREMGLEYLTLYSFSVQNWHRPDGEVLALMDLLREYCERERQTLLDKEIRLQVIGRTDRLPQATREVLLEVCEETAGKSRMTLTLALDYGGREELVALLRMAAEEAAAGMLQPEKIDAEWMAAQLTTAHMPDPDFMIRTSGELRVSNFLLWQLAYAELYFTDVNWPDFSPVLFRQALDTYGTRQRRFGTLEAKV
jgi:undecaprenyl diphosphate synthase